ncbi:MAG: hypothetical protein MJ211_09790 [Bacteroidales bacterium]|nr:hypothetical protein [Bacteroidales bacterium]
MNEHNLNNKIKTFEQYCEEWEESNPADYHPQYLDRIKHSIDKMKALKEKYHTDKYDSEIARLELTYKKGESERKKKIINWEMNNSDITDEK